MGTINTPVVISQSLNLSPPTMFTWKVSKANAAEWNPLAAKYLQVLLFWNSNTHDCWPIDEVHDVHKELERLCIDLSTHKITYEEFKKEAINFDLFNATLRPSGRVDTTYLSEEDQDKLFGTINPVKAFDPEWKWHRTWTRSRERAETQELLAMEEGSGEK